jgi:hypothetical protein
MALVISRLHCGHRVEERLALALDCDGVDLGPERQCRDHAVAPVQQRREQRLLGRQDDGRVVRVGRRLGALAGRGPDGGPGELGQVLQVLGDRLPLAPPRVVGRAQDARPARVAVLRPPRQDAELLPRDDLRRRQVRHGRYRLTGLGADQPQDIHVRVGDEGDRADRLDLECSHLEQGAVVDGRGRTRLVDLLGHAVAERDGREQVPEHVVERRLQVVEHGRRLVGDEAGLLVIGVGLVVDGRRERDALLDDRGLEDGDAGGHLGVDQHFFVDVEAEIPADVVEVGR